MIKKLALSLAAWAALAAPQAQALNPIVQTLYTADPAPVVHDGTLYLFTSHDENLLVKNFFTMKDWRCFSTTDMVNWTDHGPIASLHDFRWADPAVSGWGGYDNGAWAPQAIERAGKWFLYVPLHGRGIGVLVADNPLGPYADPLGHPLIPANYDSIDPTVFVDDDGQAYLYWGNPTLWHVRLNPDMISYQTDVGDHGVIKDPMTLESWAPRSAPDPKRPTSYEEGPWLYKRNGLYYLFFAAGPLPEHLAYSTSKSPEGPWVYGGIVMSTQGGSFTNHPGVVDYRGKTYLFYHNAALPGGGGFHRSVCIEELHFRPDGAIEPVDMSTDGARPANSLNPYRQTDAVTFAREQGMEIETASAGARVIKAAAAGAFLEIKNVDFGPTGTKSFVVSATNAAGNDSAVEVRLDRQDGPLLGTVRIGRTGGKPGEFSAAITGAHGVHDLFLVFRPGASGDGLRVSSWRFTE